jgi:hypothetical protein
MGELVLGKVSLFINAENLLNFRQTGYHPLLLRARARDGAWAVDAPSSRSRVQMAPDSREGPCAALRKRFDDPFNARPKPRETGRDASDETDRFFDD